jgi:hypothetical protein
VRGCDLGVVELGCVECDWSICMDESCEELIEVRVDIERLLSILSNEFGCWLMDMSIGVGGEV